MQQHYRVLLVEDSPSDAFLVEEALAQVGVVRFDLDRVARLSEATEILGRQRFDVILLDLNLPDAEGIDTLLKIRDLASSVPIIVCTGLDNEAVGFRLIQEGAQDYVIKGQFQGNLLIRSIRYAIERKRTEEALKEADRRKDEFLAMLSHELRNPLAPIRNAVEVLKQADVTPFHVDWARGIIDRQLTQLTRLVDDLLDISRLTCGKVTLKRESLELTTSVFQAVEASRPLIEANRHELLLRLSSNPVWVEADFARLTQVFSNLLDNAAKYTEEGGLIRLSVETDGARAVIRVQDNGTGISPLNLPHIFDLFTQEPRSLDRAQGGLGIGLSLVKRLVEMHGGEVEAHSAGTGTGSEFVVRLPLLDLDIDASEQVPPQQASEDTVSNYHVLVADADIESARSTVELLKLWGYEARAVHEGRQVLPTVRERRPEAVLVTIRPPEMDGYELARCLRQEYGHQCPKLIAVTECGHANELRWMHEARFDHHLFKPVDHKGLKALLDYSSRAHSQNIPCFSRHLFTKSS
ncbi:ATP-binding response regulator [Methylocaldum sp.]|uniref:ATP-binding response regulator n=1 Tax=Methylocaldum sp. TaxID=1969727 RepID=UPI002D3FB858|nr:response regulator [Methylocaldum sp.]HYE38067.1 response regulator [Methylocaldum sp.]